MKKNDKEKIFDIYRALENAQLAISTAKNVIREMTDGEVENVDFAAEAKKVGQVAAEGENKIIEGVFDGQGMMGPDGKQYTVPANYASKSKLVEGDILKLTIQPDGSFLYKQIGPIERVRLVGVLHLDEEGEEFKVQTEEGKVFDVIKASVTYYKGEAGDEVVVLVPKDADSKWAAIENVIKNLNVKK